MRLRPREDYELRIQSATLTITPPATLLWHRDVEGNSVGIATFDLPTNQLAVESEVIFQQYNEAPLDFLVADYAIEYPFAYPSDDKILLSAYGCHVLVRATPAFMNQDNQIFYFRIRKST